MMVQRKIDAETTCLDDNDRKSVVKWVERLHQEDSLLSFKAVDQPIESSLGLDHDLFYLAHPNSLTV
jgi:hypothetical protein